MSECLKCVKRNQTECKYDGYQCESGEHCRNYTAPDKWKSHYIKNAETLQKEISDLKGEIKRLELELSQYKSIS
jgi:hypothetical protein